MRLVRYRFGAFVLDPAARELTRNGERIALPLKSLECVAYLLVHRQRAVGRDELVSAVWGRVDVSDTVITQTLRRARKALDDAGDRQTVIRTVPGFGYRWVAEVDEVDAAAAVVEPSPSPAPAPESVPVHAPVPVPVPEPGPEPAEGPSPTAASVGPASARRWGGWKAVLMLVVVLVVGLFAVEGGRLFLRSSASAVETVQTQVTVLPVRVEPADVEFSWVRLGAMDYAAERLRAAQLKVTPSEQSLHLDALLGPGSAADPVDLEALHDVRVRSDARWLLVPTARKLGAQWRVQLRTIGQDEDMSVEASGDTALQAMAVAIDSWLQRAGRTRPRNAAPTALQEQLRRIDAELDAGQLEAARAQIQMLPAEVRRRASVQVREGQLAYRAGQMDAAAGLFEWAEAQAGDAEPAVRAKALMGLGSVELREDRADVAQRHYTQALEMAARVGDSGDVTLLGNAHNGRGAARAQLGQLKAAASDLGQARMAMRRTGDTVSAAMVGANLGRIEALRNHWPQAVQEFDAAIEVFRRFQVFDYMAATLASKATAELSMVRPAQAAETLERSVPLIPRLEDARLLAVLRGAQVEVALANGQLAQADQALRALPASGTSGQVLQRLRMSQAVARGDRKGAAALATQLPDIAETLDASTVVAAVQAAGTQAVAQRWITRWQAQQPPGQPTVPPAAAFFEAVVQARFGEPAAALAAADRALAAANRDGSSNDQVRAGLLRARVLMAVDRLEEASAVLGELDSYASADYRVAWQAWELHRRRGDAALLGAAQQQAQALAGERALDGVPLL